MTNASGRKIGTDLDRQLIQHHHEIVMEQWRQNCQITDAIFRDRKDYVVMVLRSSLLINGGAAIALIAFISRAAGTESGFYVSGAICALAAFTVGIIAAVLGVLRLAKIQHDYNIAHVNLLRKADGDIKKYGVAVQKALCGSRVPIPERPLKESHWTSPTLKKISGRMRCTIRGIALLTLLSFCVGVGTAACTLSQATAAAKFAAPALEMTETI